METTKVAIKKIKPNPNNPRIIKDDNFKKLVKSIEDFPEMLEMRPIVVNGDMMVLGGNMRLRACEAAGLKEVPTFDASKLSKAKQDEFIIKDNLAYGEYNWEIIHRDWDREQLHEWGLDVPPNDRVENMGEDEEIELEQSVQLEPPREYILIMAEPNSEEWEDLKETLKLKMVRRGGYKKNSMFDVAGIERVLTWNDFKKRSNDNSNTK